MIAPGTPAPDFTLPDQTGVMHTLGDYRGSWVILYFYPKDNTPGCTREACGFRDNSAQFTKNHAVVLGVSKDSVASHARFASLFNLPFVLLSDPTHETIERYGAWREKKFLGKPYMGIHRMTVLIDPAGRVRKVYESVTPDKHAKEILEDLSSGETP